MEIKAKKSLGQNFLHDENVLNRIATSTNAKENDLIIEIGPGKGALTKKLKATKATVLAFEIDERMIPILHEIEDDKTKVIFKDILKVDLKNELSNYTYNNLYVIANIPYYITTPIIKKLIDSELDIENIVLLVQKEFAERVSAKEGCKEYDSLTVYLNYYYKISKLFVVKNTCFAPVPKVDSAVIKFEKSSLKVSNENKFMKLIDDAFRFKRKTLKNNLKGYDWSKIYSFLESKGFKESVRAEEISLEEYIELTEYLVK